MLDHANLTAMVGMITAALDLTSPITSLLILPLFHVNGILVSVLSPLAVGGAPRSPGGSRHRRSSTPSKRFAHLLSAVPAIYAC